MTPSPLTHVKWPIDFSDKWLIAKAAPMFRERPEHGTFLSPIGIGSITHVFGSKLDPFAPEYQAKSRCNTQNKPK